MEGTELNSFSYWSPTKVVFGAGTAESAGREVKEFGGTRVLIVYGGGSAERSGVLDTVKRSIADEGIEYFCVGGARPNPHAEFVQQIVDDFTDKGVDFVIGVGGGSAIDTAKGVAHGLASPGIPIWDFFSGKVPITKSLPVGTVVTIAAAGSETSTSAVLTSVTTGIKRGVNTHFNRPRFAIMDPELTYSLPEHQTACGVADILMHTLDRYFAPDADNELTDELAEALMRVVIKNGRVAMKTPDDYKARSELMWAGSLSHNGLTGLGQTLDFAIHQLGHAVSAKYDVPHGESLTSVWPAWARYVYLDDVPRFAKYALNVWGVEADDDVTAAQAGIKATEEYFRSIGMPVTLTETAGNRVKEETGLLADLCTYHGTRTIGAFKVLGAKEILEIYQSAV